jgi:Transport and Golgi organisation 2
MCTVSFIPVRDKVFITSNRDEKQGRSNAVPPSLYKFQTGNILFPKDQDAGGSWFAVHENGHAVIFLNGAWQKHEPRPPYRKSRGLVLLDMANHESPLDAFTSISLEGIEPFTAIVWQDLELSVCRWDGHRRYSEMLPADSPYIWSSVTLYDEQIIRKRASWFSKWLSENPEPLQEDILLFHQFTGDGDRHNDLLMNRGNQVFTVSITSAGFSTGLVAIKYIDLLRQQSYLQSIVLNKAIPSK